MFLLVCEPENSPEITTQPHFNNLYLSKLTWAHSIFVHVTSGHNDLATEKKLSKFGTTLFGYLRSRSMTFVTLFLQTDMPCIYLVRAMSQLHFKTKISCLCQLGTKLCLIT